jgi:hypothetical protein
MQSKMYDLTDTEEEALPMPDQWTRGMDLSGEVKYKNLKFGSESEEHPYIIQALNAARRQPLPAGWTVQKTLEGEGEGEGEGGGEEDYFFFEPSSGLSGWDPPQLRECLCALLRRDGFSQAAERISLAGPQPSLAHTHSDLPEQQQRQEEEQQEEFREEPKEEFREEDLHHSDQDPSLGPSQSQSEEEEEEGERRGGEPADTPPASDTDTDTAGGGGSFVDWSKLRQSLSSSPPGGQGQGQDSYRDSYRDREEGYRDEDAGGGATASHYPSSIASTKSRRSQKWQDIKQYQDSHSHSLSQSTHRRRGSSSSRLPASSLASKRPAGVITQQSVRTLAVSVLQDSEQVHALLMELREAFALRRNLQCNFLYATDPDSTGGSGLVYSRESVQSLLQLGAGLAKVVIAQPGLVVRAIAAVERDSSEADLLAYIVLHRLLHPFSADNSRTTVLLLEALNFQIEHAPWDPEDDAVLRAESHSQSEGTDDSWSYMSYASRVRRHVKTPPVTEQHSLLCMLLLGMQEGRHVSFFWKPLHRPFLRDYSFPDPSSAHQTGSHSGDEAYSGQNQGQNPGQNQGLGFTPEYHETVLTSLLKCHSMRRDVSLFYRMVWRPVLPAIAGAIEGTTQQQQQQQQQKHVLPPHGQNTTTTVTATSAAPVCTFSQLISLASRIIECALLDEVCAIFPATATAMARCLAETCGKDGMYTYLLNFLLLPNLVKLLLGDNDCAENEDVYKQPLLNSLANKYFNYHEWWPTSASFVENKTNKKLRVVDVAGVLIWCVWRIFTCAVFTDPSELMVFSAAKFFQNIGINETYTEVADTRIRNVVTRMRLKILKGGECLLQLPLDVQGRDFLAEMSSNHGRAPRGRTLPKAMSALLNKRINDLMLKPEEMLNAIVISRHDSIIVFDALAFVLEEFQASREERERGRERVGAGSDTEEEEGGSEWQPSFEVEEVLLDIQDYLALCDSMDEQQQQQQGEREQQLDVEDVMLLWSEPPPRREMERLGFGDDPDDGHSFYDGEGGFDEHKHRGGQEYGGGGEYGGGEEGDFEEEYAPDHRMTGAEPPPHMLPPYPYEDEAYHTRSRGQQQPQERVDDAFYHDSNYDSPDDDDEFLDDVTMFSDIPPPPAGAPLDSVEHQHEQLCRGSSLQQRYITALLGMLHRVRTGARCSLTALLADDSWFYSPEVDISHRLAVPHNNIFDKVTSSSLVKSKPNGQGAVLPRDVNPRGAEAVGGGDYSGLAVTQKNFFNSLRFSDARPRANTRTSVDININRNAPRLTNNMLRENLITKHDPDHGFHPVYEEIYHASHGRRSDPLLDDERAKRQLQRRQHKPRCTKITLPENSPLLMPTVSLCCKPAARQPHSKIHKTYINSLRTPDPEPTEREKTKHKRKKKPYAAGAGISPTRPLVSFPEHLRGRVRHDPNNEAPTDSTAVLEHSVQRQNSLFSAADSNHADYYEHQKQSGRNNFHGHERRMDQYGRGKYHPRTNAVPSKAKERKMPTPVRAGATQDSLFTATISHSLKLEDDDDFEITAEQEKGWMAQLRSWEAMDNSNSFQGSRVIAPLQRKPFFPSGHVEPVRLRSQQRRLPEHLSPGKNRPRRSRHHSNMRLHEGLHGEEGGRSWYDYREDDSSFEPNSNQVEQERQRDNRESQLSPVQESRGDQPQSSSPSSHVAIPASVLARQRRGLGEQPADEEEIKEGGSGGAMHSTWCPESNFKQLSDTLKLLRLQTPSQRPDAQQEEPRHHQQHQHQHQHQQQQQQQHQQQQQQQQQQQRGEVEGDESSEKLLSSLNDPSLQAAARQTEGVLSRLQRRLEQNKHQSKQQQEQQSMQQEQQGEEGQAADENNENKNAQNFAHSAQKSNKNTLVIKTSLLLEAQPSPAEVKSTSRPQLTTSPSSYSLQFAGTDSPVKERPSRRDGEDPPVLTAEEEERNLDEFSEHQRRCEALSPRELRSRMVVKGRWHQQQEDGDEEREEALRQQAEQQHSETSPFLDLHGSSGPAVIPVICKQHSLSTLAKREKLMQGYEVTKHSEVGYGKKKLLRYEPSGHMLQWKPLCPSVFSRLKKPQEAKFIRLQDITEVRRGVESSALRKAGLLDPACCLSIVTDQVKDGKPRTLDVVFRDKVERDGFVRGVEIILQHLSHHSVQFM